MSTFTQIPESSRLDANVRIDARLDYMLPKHFNEHTNFSFRSYSSDTIGDKGCHHYKTVLQGTYDTCFHCGVYVSKNGVKSYKSEKMNYFAFFPSKTIYETLTRRSHHFKQSQNLEYSHLRPAYVDWILELAEKLRISSNSTHLAVILLDIVMFKDPSLTPKIQLFAPICLLIAAKTIELDERIPYLPKLKKFANSSYSIDEFRKAELHVLDLVEWNAQFSTALEITEFLLCQGVLFSSDEIDENSSPINGVKRSPEALVENTQHENTNYIFDQKKGELEKNLSPGTKENNENSYSDASTVGTHNDSLSIPYLPSGQLASDDVFQSPTRCVPPFLKHNSTPATIGNRFSANKSGKLNERKIGEILSHFESNYIKLATMLLKDIDFIQFEPKVVSGAMLAFLRYVNRLVQIWNFELEAITGLQFSQVSPCFEIIYKKYTSTFRVQTFNHTNVLGTIDSNRNLVSDLRLTQGNASISDKSGDIYSTNKITLTGITESYMKPLTSDPLGKYDLNAANNRAFEKKTIFGAPGKTAIPPTSNISSTYLYDNITSRPKYSVPVSADLQPRSLSRNTIFPNNYQPSKFNTNQEYSGSYHNQAMTVGSTRTDIASGSYSTYGSYADIPSENYYRSDSQLNSRTTSITDNGSRKYY